MSRRLCFEYQAPGQFEARRRFVIVDGACRKKKSLFVTARGGEEKKGWRASASIACSPTLLSAVCFPSGPFCFSSISDLATLSLRLRVTPNQLHPHLHPFTAFSRLLSFGYPRQQTPDIFSLPPRKRLQTRRSSSSSFSS